MCAWSKARGHCHCRSRLARLFPNDVHRNEALVGTLAVFPNVNALPRPERHTSIPDWNAQVYCCERRANVRGHIVVTLGVVLEHRIPIPHKPAEEPFQISPDRWIGVLLDE